MFENIRITFSIFISFQTFWQTTNNKYFNILIELFFNVHLQLNGITPKEQIKNRKHKKGESKRANDRRTKTRKQSTNQNERKQKGRIAKVRFTKRVNGCDKKQNIMFVKQTTMNWELSYFY